MGSRTFPEPSPPEAAVLPTLEAARSENRSILLEPEGLRLLEAVGIPVAAHRYVRGARQVDDDLLGALGGGRVVVKVVSPDVVHKTDVGGVEVVEGTREAIVGCIDTMARRLSDVEVFGFTVHRFVEYDRSIGGELLLSARWTDDFGPVVTVGAGGIHAEFLARHLRAGEDVAMVSPDLDPATIEAAVRSKPVLRLACRPFRGRAPRIDAAVLSELVHRLGAFAARFLPAHLAEIEVNPLALTPGGPLALDVFARLGAGATAPPGSRPVDKIRRLLRPDSMAIAGVSTRMNPGHVILVNSLGAGFDPERIFVIKPGTRRIEGCRCFPSIAELPGTVDLCVLAMRAEQIPDAIDQILSHRKAESVIVIPGGLGEREGTQEIAGTVSASLARARRTPWRGPVINGGNCLGIRSKPGRYDTTFIPAHKMPAPSEGSAPLALVSQSGAFAVAATTALPRLQPRYLISVGNQTDLTVGDYLAWLADDEDTRVVACYVEGFRPGDGRQWLEASARIVSRGGAVLLYRSGRTSAGARASVSHTASIAGDYAITRELARQSGAVVADTLEDFVDLIRLFCLLDGREVAGRRLGALSNAGFECVAMADRLGGFRLASFGPATGRRLGAILERCGISRIVEVRNPFDATPIMDDETLAEAMRAILEDDDVDAGLVGCVPLTGALQTLPESPDHSEDFEAAGSIVRRMIDLWRSTSKPWVAVVDGGLLYDPMARRLEAGGVPVFRKADRASRLFDVWCSSRVGEPTEAPSSPAAAAEAARETLGTRER